MFQAVGFGPCRCIGEQRLPLCCINNNTRRVCPMTGNLRLKSMAIGERQHIRQFASLFTGNRKLETLWQNGLRPIKKLVPGGRG